MRQSNSNLFLRLHAWAPGQDENFTSEAFAYVLQYLVEYEPNAGVSMLRQLTGGRLDLGPADAALVTITTQVIVTEGRPDIEIRTRDHLVYVEVKIEAVLGERQLGRYRCALDRSSYAHTTLVLLTRYPVIVSPPGDPDVAIRWYDVADWLDEEVRSGRVAHAPTIYLVRQFLDFLHRRNLAMGEVGPELGRGVQSLGNLLAMIKEAIDGDKRIKVSNSYLSSDFVGYYLGTSAYFIGLHYEQPAVLEFATYNVTISEESFSTLNVGQLWEERPVGLRWRNRLDLEDGDFFTLPKALQLRRIEGFYRQSLTMAEQLTNPS